MLAVGRKSAIGRWLAVFAACVAALVVTPPVPAQSGTQSGARPASTAGSLPAAVPASRKAHNVAVITIKDEIRSVTAESVRRRIAFAERAGADAIVFEIDTPGGDLYAALTICKLIKNCPIPNTVAWVNTKAYSAGALIALACREIVTTPSADFGDALPIMVNPLNGNLLSLGKAERQKITAPMIAEVVDSARRNGYDEYLVQGFVSLGVELWLVENNQTKQRMCVNREEYRRIFNEDPPTDRPRVASSHDPSPSPAMPPITTAAPASTVPLPSQTDQAQHDSSDPTKLVRPASPQIAGTMNQGSSSLLYEIAPTTRPLITATDRGRWHLVEFVTEGTGPLMLKADDMKALGLSSETVTQDADLQAFFGAKNIRRLDQSWSEGLVAFLTMIPVQIVLIVIFLIALFVEMTHPGVILPGAIAAVALFGLLAPSFIIGMAGWWEVVAIVGGILLILLEIFVIPGFGLPGIIGILALFAGLIGTFVPNGSGGLFPDTPQARTELMYGFTSVMLAAATAGIGMYFLARNFGTLPILNRLVLKNPESSDGPSDMLAAMGPSGTSIKPGDVGVAITPLRPSGRIQIGEQIYDVVAELSWVPSGATVRVVSASEFRIAVELLHAPPEPLPQRTDPGASA